MSENINVLAAELGRASSRVASVLFDAYKESGEAFAEDWANNARSTAGAHARDYPGFIDSESRVAFGVSVEIGPRAEGQGMLGRILELGSATSPPHLDGARALPAAESRLGQIAGDALSEVMP